MSHSQRSPVLPCEDSCSSALIHATFSQVQQKQLVVKTAELMRPVDLVVLSRPCGLSRLSAFRLWSMAFSWQIMSCFLLLVYYLNNHPGIIKVLDLQGPCVLSHLFPSFYKYACWHLGRVTGSPDHTCPLWRHQGWSAQFWLMFRGFPQCHTMLFLLE